MKEKVKNRLTNIQTMRVIACFGVFFGHFASLTFPSDKLGLLITQLREGILSYTPVAWFTMGDVDVLFFFAAGGFFLSYTFNDNADIKTTIIKLAEKICTLLLPGIIITLIFAGLKILTVNDVQLVRSELIADIIRIIRGTYNDSYQPTLSYQLWYIHFMARGTVFGIWYNYLFRKNSYLREIILCLLIPVFWLRNLNGIWQIAVGMFAGNIVKDIGSRTLPIKNEIVTVCGIAALLLVPLECKHGGTAHNITAMLMVAIFLVCDAVAERSKPNIQPGNIMRLLEKNNYSFYLLHVMVLTFIVRPIYDYLFVNLNWNEIIVLTICFIIAITVTMALSEVFTKYVLSLFKFSRRKKA